MSFFTMIYNILIGPLQLVFEIIFSLAYRLLDHAGLAIIALSLMMNILVLPLYKRSDAMQEAARDIDEKLKKGVTHIKKTFSGDEQMMILQTYYRQNNYKPTDALNGSVSLLLEVPFFMAAYQFLSHLEILQGVSLGPIENLGAPDGLITIAGITINVLPVLMTLVNIVSSAIYTKGFPMKTKVQLYVMALFFLFFLYTSPSGLVFYWTLNNVFSLGKNIVYKIIAYVKKKPALEEKKVEVENDATDVKSDKKMFILGSLVLTLLVGLVIPSTYIGASVQEFIDITYYHDPTWYVVNATCLAIGTFMVWMRVFYWIASEKGKALFDSVVWIMCGVALVNYLFFGTNLGIISSTLEYETGMVFTKTELILNVITIIIVSIVLYVVKLKWSSLVKTVLLTVAIALLGMSVMNVADIRTIVEATEKQIENSEFETPRFTLSKKGNNVIVLMLDRALAEYVPYIFNEHPELEKKFSGFTYYSNTISYGQCTNFAAPALFGGYEYVPVELNKRDEEPLVKKHNEALKLMPVIFEENDYEVTVCDPPYANYSYIPDLTIYDDYPDIKTYITEGAFSDPSSKQQTIESNKRNFFVFSVMKCLPLGVQNILYQGGNYNQLLGPEMVLEFWHQIIYSEIFSEGVDADSMNPYNVLLNMANMTWIDEGDKDTFMMLTNMLTHQPMMLQLPNYEPVPFVYNGDQLDLLYPGPVNGRELITETTFQIIHYQSNAAALMRLGEWFDYLRENGVYDNTRIIIAADHGYGVYQIEDLFMGDELNNDTLEYYYPLLMVKDFNSNEYTVSDEFMTNADVPTLAFEGLIENPINPFTGNPVNNEAKSGEQYITPSQEWDIAINNGNTFIPSQWYAVKDNMWDKNNWRLIDEYLVDPTGY